MALKNLKAEMTRSGIKQQEVADYLEMSLSNLNLKLNGKVPMTVPEIMSLKKRFFPGMSLDYLCESDKPAPSKAEQVHEQIGIIRDALVSAGVLDEDTDRSLSDFDESFGLSEERKTV